MTGFIKNLAKKEILVPHINRYMNKANFPKKFEIDIRTHKEPDDAFHPSSDCSPCALALYAGRMGIAEKAPLTGTNHKAFFVGHFWHEILQQIICDGLEYCEKSDIEKELRYKEEDGWWARGFADIARCEVPGRGSYLIDFKTMNGFHFAKPPKSLLAKWRTQVACYMAWDNRVESAIIIGIQKDAPHDFQEFVFERDDTILEPIYRKWSAVAEAVKTGIPPVCECEECNVILY